MGLQRGYLFNAQIKPLYFKKFKSVSFHFVNDSVGLIYNLLSLKQTKRNPSSKAGEKDDQFIFIEYCGPTKLNTVNTYQYEFAGALLSGKTSYTL